MTFIAPLSRKNLFTDTDSLTYEVKSKDVYEEFFKYKHLTLKNIN